MFKKISDKAVNNNLKGWPIKEIREMRKMLETSCCNKTEVLLLAYVYITQAVATLRLLGDNKFIANIMYVVADHFATLSSKE